MAGGRKRVSQGPIQPSNLVDPFCDADIFFRNKKPSLSPATLLPTTRARDRFSPLLRMLKRISQSSDSSSGSGGGNGRPKLYPLWLERAEAQSSPHGLNSMYKMIFRRSIGPAGVWMVAISCVDVNMRCTKIPKALTALVDLAKTLNCSLCLREQHISIIISESVRRVEEVGRWYHDFDGLVSRSCGTRASQ